MREVDLKQTTEWIYRCFDGSRLHHDERGWSSLTAVAISEIPQSFEEGGYQGSVYNGPSSKALVHFLYENENRRCE